MLGDPNCPLCHGVGYLRRDLPVSHPDFGRVTICDCRRGQVSRQVRDNLFSLSHLDELKEMTFETFQPQGRKGLSAGQVNSLEWAYNHARQYAANLNGWLLLQGGYGCGKTHLAAAVANAAVNLGVSTLFLTAPDLLDSLRFAYEAKGVTFEERFEAVRTVPFLVLDDLGTQNATEWAQEKLFQIINYRYINKLPLLVTMNLEMDDIDARIRSRLCDPELVSVLRINASDYRRPVTDAGHPELSYLHLHADQTFANFDDRTKQDLSADELQSLEKAIKSSRAFANKPRGWLVLIGPYGCGKTHLAAAIANDVAVKGIPPIFITAADLLDQLRAAFEKPKLASYDTRFETLREAPMLIIDDLGAQSVTPWSREKYHQLLDYRYAAKLPTVLTIAADKIETIDPQLKVRLEDDRLCTKVIITAPAYFMAKKRKTR